MTERVAIVGSRAKHWPHADVRAAQLAIMRLVGLLAPDAVVISGDSPGGGVDQWARNAAEAMEAKFVAHWPGTYTKQGMPFGAACFRRNTDIANDCTRVIAVCPTASPTAGTLDTMRKAKAMGKRVTLVVVAGGNVESIEWKPEEKR